MPIYLVNHKHGCGCDEIEADSPEQAIDIRRSNLTEREADNPDTKRGADLVAGDVVFCGEKSRTITGFRDHPGLGDNPARVLLSGEYGITVFDNDTYRILNGVYYPTHLWWSAKHGTR